MATGIAVNDECVKFFNDMKLNKSFKYLVFTMDDALTSVVVDKKGEKDASYDSFKEELPADDCRYAVIDFNYEGPDGHRDKLIFINWAPDTAKIKRKMIFASTKASLKDKLVGLSFEVQATDLSEIDHDEVLNKSLALSK